MGIGPLELELLGVAAIVRTDLEASMCNPVIHVPCIDRSHLHLQVSLYPSQAAKHGTSIILDSYGYLLRPVNGQYTCNCNVWLPGLILPPPVVSARTDIISARSRTATDRTAGQAGSREGAVDCLGRSVQAGAGR